MNKKITTIELLKLIKEEKQPKTIRFALYTYHWNDDYGSYERNAEGKNISLFKDAEGIFTLSGFADEEVEILEDEEEIDIQKIPIIETEGGYRRSDCTNFDMALKINEIIDKVNKLDKKINKEE